MNTSHGDRPLKLLNSSHILLRPLERSDLETLARWRNAPENYQRFFNTFPIAISGQDAWYQDLLKRQDGKLFIIEALGDGKAIGTIGYDHIDWKNQKAELGNTLIGELTYRGKGLGKEAVRLILHFGFSEMNLNRIYLKVYAKNKLAIHVYESCGFHVEGILQEEYFRNGRFQDVCLMAILRKEYPDLRQDEGL